MSHIDFFCSETQWKPSPKSLAGYRFKYDQYSWPKGNNNTVDGKYLYESLKFEQTTRCEWQLSCDKRDIAEQIKKSNK